MAFTLEQNRTLGAFWYIQTKKVQIKPKNILFFFFGLFFLSLLLLLLLSWAAPAAYGGSQARG